MKKVRRTLTLISVIVMMTILGGHTLLKYHHHDCEGRVCLAEVGHENEHHGDFDDSHHIHPCPAGHFYLSAQSHDSGPSPLFVLHYSVFVPEEPQSVVVPGPVVPRYRVYTELLKLTPTGCKAPPV